jgi:hypothetical protein
MLAESSEGTPPNTKRRETHTRKEEREFAGGTFELRADRFVLGYVSVTSCFDSTDRRRPHVELSPIEPLSQFPKQIDVHH